MPGRAEADAAAHAGPTGHVLPAAPTPRVGAPGHRRRPRPARSRGASPGWGPLHLLSAVPWPDTSPGGSSGTGRAPRAPEGPAAPPPRSQEPQRPPGTAAGMWGAHGLPSHTGPWPWLDGHGPQLPPALHLPTAAGEVGTQRPAADQSPGEAERAWAHTHAHAHCS